MADEDLSLNEDQLLDNLDDAANGDLMTEVRGRKILKKAVKACCALPEKLSFHCFNFFFVLQEEGGMQIDPELEAIKARVKEMEEEAEKLKMLQSEVNKQLQSPTGVPVLSAEEKKEIDDRSVYVGNVDYGATAEELEAHFHGCGSINRVTILCNKIDGHPKGFAYIEFGAKEFVETALAMNETLFRGRQIKVSACLNGLFFLQLVLSSGDV